jgi:4-diphosphocytidyl-2-C-methyl-D-erythritol kinase
MRLSRRGPSLLVQTPAKLNLFLNVLGRRQDGFHDLETLMVSIRLYDTIQFESSPSEIELLCRSAPDSPQAIPSGEENLIVRAARLLQAETGCKAGSRITLWKRIPSQAGLGGGSSDAAATLVALDRLWRTNLPLERLHALAARLGSDVNFFLDSSLASVCTGRGERTEPVALRRPLHFVVIKPASGLSTGDVFQEWGRESAAAPPVTLTECAASLGEPGSPGGLRRWLYNALEGPAGRLNGEIEGILKTLSRWDVVWGGMTGSGSACFGLCRSAAEARSVAGRLKSLNLGRVFVVRSGV